MKLTELNHKDIKAFHNAVYKHHGKKTDLNVNKATGDPDKTELPDRSGNQQTKPPVGKRKILGASDNSRDKQTPSNLTK